MKPIRLKGKPLEALRRACFERDSYRCSECDVPVGWDGYWLSRGHMAHIIGRGRGGSDELHNVRTLCVHCHLVGEHNPKSVPAKDVA